MKFWEWVDYGTGIAV